MVEAGLQICFAVIELGWGQGQTTKLVGPRSRPIPCDTYIGIAMKRVARERFCGLSFD